MNPLLLAGAFAGMLAVACTGTPASPGTSPAGTVPGAGDVVARVCGTADGSLSNVADQLEGLDADTDTAQLQVTLGSLASDLSAMEVQPDQVVARDAAVTAIGEVQQALTDPNTLPEVGRTAAAALRTAEATLCPS